VNSYAKSADSYLIQRITSAGPEQQAALLMEAGQKFIGKAIKAIEQKDHMEVARCLFRVTQIINESICRLNYEDGGELVQNLVKIYDWWNTEIFEVSATKDAARLEILSHHMGEIRQAWEQLHDKQIGASRVSEFTVGDRLV